MKILDVSNNYNRALYFGSNQENERPIESRTKRERIRYRLNQEIRRNPPMDIGERRLQYIINEELTNTILSSDYDAEIKSIKLKKALDYLSNEELRIIANSNRESYKVIMNELNDRLGKSLIEKIFYFFKR